MHDFYFLEAMEKVELLCVEGVMLGERVDGCFAISLLQLDNFYVEVYFHTTQQCIKNIRSFNDTSELTAYLEQVDISGLF